MIPIPNAAARHSTEDVSHNTSLLCLDELAGAGRSREGNSLRIEAVVLNRLYSRRTFELNRQLHDQLETEVDVIDHSQEPSVRRHYDAVASWRVKLPDCEALNFGTMELFVLGVMVLSMLRTCSSLTASPGDIFAVFRYVLMLLMGIDGVPKLVQQFSRLRDLTLRFQQT